MPERNKKTDKKNPPSKTKGRKEHTRHEGETMSQIQNRYGNGRKRNGSDGSSTEESGSNH